MKKNLDKYLKQKLETPQPPPEHAWEFIQSRIPKEKDNKKIIPFWIKLSGIAATLLLMIGFGYWLGIQNNAIYEIPESITKSNYNSENPNPLQDIQDETDFQGEIPNYLSTDKSEYERNPANSFSVKNEQKIIYSNNNIHFINSQNTNYENELKLYSLDEKSIYPSVNKTYKYALNSDLNPIVSSYLPDIKDAQLNHSDKEFLLALNVEKPEKEKKKKKKVDFERFHISAFASPLSFNTFVGNSMLADEMSEFNTENNVTLAYGFKAGYSLNPRLRIRTGVSVIGLEQITHDVPLAVEVAGRAKLTSVDKINNVNYQGNVRIDNRAKTTLLVNEEISEKIGYGNMQQQTSYIEIPVEAEYSLFNTNSIGISATGGGSTWVLSKNKIYVHTDDYTQELGEANNLNNVTFSANAGLKFDLNISDHVKLNVEPNFRYLFNPVNNIEKYNPYTVGVNAGVSVSFK